MSSRLTSESTDLCKICNLYYFSTQMDAHMDLHVRDANTPIAILRDGQYDVQLTRNYSGYTIFGQFSMIKKFVELPLPSGEMYKDSSSYQRFVKDMKEIKRLYYSVLFDTEDDERFLSNAHHVLTLDLFKTNMDKLTKCVDHACTVLLYRLTKPLIEHIQISLQILKEIKAEKEKLSQAERDAITSQINNESKGQSERDAITAEIHAEPQCDTTIIHTDFKAGKEKQLQSERDAITAEIHTELRQQAERDAITAEIHTETDSTVSRTQSA